MGYLGVVVPVQRARGVTKRANRRFLTTAAAMISDVCRLNLSFDLARRQDAFPVLGAITTVPRKLGRGSGLKINDVFWTTFLNNANFFKAANNNYIQGTDTARRSFPQPLVSHYGTADFSGPNAEAAAYPST